MKIPLEEKAEPRFELMVNGEQWERVASLDCSGPDDRHYSLDREAGMITFGDGEHGQRPPSGSSIRATYSYGDGAEAERVIDSGPTITLTWNSKSFRKNEIIMAMVESQVNGIIFQVCRESEVPHRWKCLSMLSKNIERWALRLIG